MDPLGYIVYANFHNPMLSCIIFIYNLEDFFLVLKNTPIIELEEGVYVDSDTEKNGNFKIKNSAQVTSDTSVSELKKPHSFENEIRRASKLHHKGKAIQRQLKQAISHGSPVDLVLSKAFIGELVSSIKRNSDALLCMTKIRVKGSYSIEHGVNVAILLANLASRLDMTALEVQELALVGFLYDIGKTKVPDEILHKAGRLSDQEMVVMRNHVHAGITILQDMAMPEHLIKTVSEHHEHLDGHGYPKGLRGDEISICGRMLGIVDSYDAITADRGYKAAVVSQKALQILHAQAPQKYDPHLIQQFVRSIGVYPVGSLVKLSSEKIAMVIKIQPSHLLKPVVKVFYSVRSKHYLSPVMLDLQKSQHCIKKAVLADEFNLDFNRYFNEYIVL
jgi:putative nucleotidyltransferase with HDIG domain